MSNQKRVLVVVDEEILRNGMRVILEGIGFYVDEAEDGQVAKGMLLQKEYFLIVSNAELPVVNGLALLDFVRRTGMTLRFLLINGSSSSLQERQVLQLGGNGLLNKPFSKADLLRAIDASLTNSELSEGGSIESEFVQVPASDFIAGSFLKVDLYVRMSTSKYLKIGNKDGGFAPERVKNYMAKGIRWFYMRKVDFAFYVGFSIDLAQLAYNQNSIEYGKQIRLTTQVTETLISQMGQGGLDRERLEDASNVVMNAVELIATNTSTLKLLESVEVAGDLPSHSIAVAIWACLIARQVQWSGQSTFFRLAVSALFHDVGQKEVDETLMEKKRYELTKDERKLLESHTFRGRDILESMPGIPEDAITVALQHHELVSGGGYPYGIKLEQIHPFARLISVADRFCELLRDRAPNKKLEYPEIFEKLTVNQRDFDATFLQGLRDIVMKKDHEDFDAESVDSAKRSVN